MQDVSKIYTERSTDSPEQWRGVGRKPIPRIPFGLQMLQQVPIIPQNIPADIHTKTRFRHLGKVVDLTGSGEEDEDEE